MRQCRWLELIKDYNLEIHYHLGKSNVVADALSRKSYCNNLLTSTIPPELCQEMDKLQIEVIPKNKLNELWVQHNLGKRICEAQQNCPEIQEIWELMELDKCPEFREDEQGLVWYKDRICVPSDEALEGEILAEGHDSKYYIHPGSTKMYVDLKKHFW